MKQSGLFYPVLLLAFWTFIVLAADVVVVTTSIKQALAWRYVPVSARIVESRMGGNIIRSGVILEYNYSVNGTSYTGHRYRYDDRNLAYQYSDTTNNNPVWAERTIFYNPADPADSVISPGLAGCDLLLVLFGVPLNIATVAIWVLRFPLRARINSEAGGIRVWTDRIETRARLAELSPAGVGWLALALACFCSAFPIVSFWGFSPPLTFVLVVLILCLLVAFCAFLWMTQRQVSGYYDLRIQDDAVTVPAIAQRAALCLRRDEISGIALITRETRNPSGTHISYIPAIQSKLKSLHLVRWGWDEERARAFAKWLSQRLNVQFKGTISENSSSV